MCSMAACVERSYNQVVDALTKFDLNLDSQIRIFDIVLRFISDDF